ncbi:excalibur calcium-binding domain-containing protein [Actinomyces sp. 186855]|nr:excalibur calcium-binding domain-containing protein [Actinomyces sp. AC-20-1]MCL3789287.1 excalibur calcium-binding domain-containing protein [Actinomyces sp. 187325]MCL3791707.1 excalibur calcium-binding domain-containing protein [Actinomyces sp. 186855]MCL3794253.1 excalibur calcium-binding domain-containing protein [Actinomyces sp. 217892]
MPTPVPTFIYTTAPQETSDSDGAASVADPVPAPAPEPAQADAYYANCTEARQAGAAPLYVGDPGYRSGLDRDKDGIACE